MGKASLVLKACKRVYIITDPNVLFVAPKRGQKKKIVSESRSTVRYLAHFPSGLSVADYMKYYAYSYYCI